MSRMRGPRTRPRRVLPSAWNVASLNGVSGLVEISGRCARAGATIASTNPTATSRRMSLPPAGDMIAAAHRAGRRFLIPTLMGDSRAARFCHDRRMTTDLLTSLSNQLADAVAAAAPSVVQVQGRRRPASGLVYADDVVLTTVRALGREDNLHVRRHDGHLLDAELAGWDPASGLAVLRVPGLGVAAIRRAPAEARVGHLALAVARSWSNVVTASAGLVSVIGGPLPTGRGQSVDQVIRTTAPVHH